VARVEAVPIEEPQGGRAPEQADLAIVGGGIVGLAVARELAQRNPGSSVCVLERETTVAAHQTGHNSGVIHGGVYYEPGSLKAALCVQGARRLYEYCEANAIENERCGKLILATERSELARLEEIERRGRANGVAGLQRLDAAGIERYEPHARGIAALHSPNTGIVDFTGVARSYARDVIESGGVIATGCEVRGVERRARALRIAHSHGVTEAGHAVFCAGAWADRLAVLAGASADPRIVPFRGAYLKLKPERRHLVRSLIYPVPDPALPFLGVHLTKHISGDVLIGPTALMAGARDAYRLSLLRRRDVRETLAWPGTWLMLKRFWRTGLTELRHAAVRSAFVHAAARFLPELRASDIEPSFAGVRAQALSRDGKLLDDFVFSQTERALHVRNAPSPAATSSLAIASYVADEAQRLFALQR
jgi:(S)-2-hydroxyglutarate dehydrogenase